MTKQAHITSRPGVQVGDKALALCEKEFKVKVLWADLPDDKPICRDCVDVALTAMSETDKVIETARRLLTLTTMRVNALSDTLRPDGDLMLDVIAENADDFADRQSEKREAKAEKKRAKSTCTCTWTSPESMQEDPECPIHGTWHEEPAEEKQEGDD